MSSELAGWGRTTPTRVVRLRSGERVVVQLVHDRPTAAWIVDATRILTGHGIPVPAIRRSRTTGRGTFIVFDHVPGVPGPTLVDGPRGGWLADRMGELLGHLASVPQGSSAADPVWSSPGNLAAAAPSWLAELPEAETRARLEVAIRRLTDTVWTPRLTHGDYAPANVLVRGDGSLVLLDLGAVAGRHPRLDEAWWGLVVRYHHPAKAGALARRLRTAAHQTESTASETGRGHQDGLGDAADIAAVRALQLHAWASPSARPHLEALIRAALAWVEDR